MAVDQRWAPEAIQAVLAQVVALPCARVEGCTLIGTVVGKPVSRLLTARDLRDMFGLDPKTLAEWEEKKAFPARRQVSPIMGGKIAWDRQEVEDWWRTLPRGIAGSKTAQEQEA